MRHSRVKGFVRRTSTGKHCRVRPHMRRSYKAMPLQRGDFVKSKMTGASGVVVNKEPFVVDYTYEDKEHKMLSNPKYWAKKG